MFSIIIPLYNKEKYIQRAVTSVLNQSFNEFELIIVDDASDDSSLDVVKRIHDNRIQIIERNERGFGGYAARNLGVEHAKFDFVSFLDADDEWNRDYLLSISDLIKIYPNNTLFSTAWQEKSGSVIKYNAYYNKHKSKGNHIIQNFFEEAVNGRSPIHTNIITIKKQIYLDKGGFPQGKCKRGGDIEFWMRLMIDNDLTWSPYIGATYYKDISEAVTKTISRIEVPYVYRSVSSILTDNPNNERALKMKKYANHYAKMAIIHAVVYNKKKNELLKAFFKEADMKFFMFFKLLAVFPPFILRPVYTVYRKLMIQFSKSDLG